MILQKNKLENFEHLVLNHAEKKRDEILSQFTIDKEEKVSKIKSELSAKYSKLYDIEIQKVSHKNNENIINKQIEKKQQILHLREDLINNIFQDVETMLCDYTKTEKYVNSMIKIVNESLKSLSADTVILVNKDDAGLITALEGLNLKTEAVNDKFIGGCIMVDKSKNVRIDETFSSRLKSARDKFLEIFNVKV